MEILAWKFTVASMQRSGIEATVARLTNPSISVSPASRLRPTLTAAREHRASGLGTRPVGPFSENLSSAWLLVVGFGMTSSSSVIGVVARVRRVDHSLRRVVAQHILGSPHHARRARATRCSGNACCRATSVIAVKPHLPGGARVPPFTLAVERGRRSSTAKAVAARGKKIVIPISCAPSNANAASIVASFSLASPACPASSRRLNFVAEDAVHFARIPSAHKPRAHPPASGVTVQSVAPGRPAAQGSTAQCRAGDQRRSACRQRRWRCVQPGSLSTQPYGTVVDCQPEDRHVGRYSSRRAQSPRASTAQ